MAHDCTREKSATLPVADPLGTTIRIPLIVNFVLLIYFNSFGQKDTIAIIHNGYSFHTEAVTIIKHYQIEKDSIDFYINGLSELFKMTPEISSDSIIEFGTIIIDFGCLLDIFDDNHALVKIKRIHDNQRVKYKVKYIKEEDRTKGIGGSSKTYIIIIDKRKKVEIVHEIIKRNLAC